MNTNTITAILIASAALLACVFMCCEYNRYSIHTGTDSIAGYRLDKKTGEIYFLRGENRTLQKENSYNISAVRVDDVLK